MALHTHGSSNPLGVGANTDRLPMHPYYIFKDLVTILGALLGIAVLVLYVPNILGHSDNYIPANPLQTPSSINNKCYYILFIVSALIIACGLNTNFDPSPITTIIKLWHGWLNK